MGKNVGTGKTKAYRTVVQRISYHQESADPFGNRAERRKAKKLGIKPEHVLTEQNNSET